MPGIPKDGIRAARPRARRSLAAAAFSAAAAVFTACQGGDGLPAGSDALTGPGANIPFTAAANTEASFNPADVIGPSCHSDDPEHVCLGLKYVAYQQGTDAPTLTETQALDDMTTVNTIWTQCNLGFEIDAFDTVDPKDSGLNFDLTDTSELEAARSVFGTIDELLLVVTGEWNRTGTLGQSTANAWTALPGGAPYGVVLEEDVANHSANLVAHELGHYLNLVHVTDETNLMDPIIYGDSTLLTADQCGTARSAATYFWRRMLR